MDDYKVIWSARSLKDLDTSYRFLTEKSQQAASRSVEAVLEKVTQLEKFPESGAVEPALSHRKKSPRYWSAIITKLSTELRTHQCLLSECLIHVSIQGS